MKSAHHENRALVKRLEIDLQLYDEEFDLTPYSAYALVDTQNPETPISDQLGGKTLLSFIDHHRRLGTPLAEFVDIREDAASTCAIYAEYLRAQYPDGLNPGETDQVRLATALMHGIRSDTMALIEASRLEFEAAGVSMAVRGSAPPQGDLGKILTADCHGYDSKGPGAEAGVRLLCVYRCGVCAGRTPRWHPPGGRIPAPARRNRLGPCFGIVDGKTVDGSLRTRSDTVNLMRF